MRNRTKAIAFAFAAAFCAGIARNAEGSPDASERPSKEPVRTLDEITIEGEIPLPQVLFISSREEPRYGDLLHRRYFVQCADVGMGGPIAAGVWVVGRAWSDLAPVAPPPPDAAPAIGDER
jgi:hypothetical protein